MGENEKNTGRNVLKSLIPKNALRRIGSRKKGEWIIVAKEAGYQTECVDFSCIKWDRGDLQDPIRMMELFSQAMEQAKYKIAGIDLAGTDDVLFISKSIGTVVAAGYALENGIKAKQFPLVSLHSLTVLRSMVTMIRWQIVKK